MATREELEAAVRAAPLDDDAYLVLGDWLVARGDPRGELIAIDAAILRATPAEAARLRVARHAFLVEHPELVPPRGWRVRIAWHLGYVCAATGYATDELEALLAHPSLSFVSTLGIDGDVAPEWLAAHLPATVSRFELELRATWKPVTDPDHIAAVDDVLAACPNVRRLVCRVNVRLARPSRLVELELLDTAIRELGWVDAWHLPELRSLHVQFGREVRVVDLERLLVSPPPHLTSLELVHPPGDEMIAALAESPLLPQLKTLRLWNAGLTVAGARSITHARFGHLDVLDLSDPAMHSMARLVVGGVCPDVRIVPRRR